MRARVAIAFMISGIGLSAATARQQARWTASLALQAGTLDGPGALTEVFDLEIGPTGELLAGQPTIGSISVFSADGEYIRTVGRRGRGPGEFFVLGRMGWSGDTLWVVDFGRLQLFDRSLEFVRSITFPTLQPPSGVGRLIPGPPLADGTLLGVPVMVQPGRRAPVVRLSTEGAILDTLVHVTMENTYLSVPVSGSGRSGNITRPWIDNPIWASALDGQSIIVLNRPLPEQDEGNHFEILEIGLRGDTILRRQLPYSPVPWSRSEVNEWYASKGRAVSAQLTVTEDRAERAVRQAVEPPRYHLPVTDMVLGRDGSIWLRREETRQSTVEWQVFSDGGMPIGAVALPSSFEVHRAERGRVWGVARDSLDVSYLQVYDVSN